MEDLISVCTPRIAKAEDLKLRLYKDTTGHNTIGYGHNLDAKGISKKVADLMFQEDLEEAINGCKEKINFFDNLEVPYQYVLVNLAFNMGIGGLLSFETMLSLMYEGKYPEAAQDLSRTLEFKEVPNRIFPLIKILETGKLGD